MLTIRLQRVGRKNDPSFRVVVTESKNKPQTGKYLEMVGSYDARTDRVDIKADRIKHWISMGATTSETVHNMLINQKVIEGKKINVLPRKSPPKKEEEPAAPVAEAPAAAEAPIEEATPAPVEETAPEAPAEAPVSNDVAPEAEAK
ncbi:30S ribosomal protein S16 [Acetobacteraceae bacterium]|nr:30S ribosomal protein S16 [Candidatus Parcubacteria bacterium]